MFRNNSNGNGKKKWYIIVALLVIAAVSAAVAWKIGWLTTLKEKLTIKKPAAPVETATEETTPPITDDTILVS